MTSYQPGVPTGTVFLNQDYLNIMGNFQQIQTTYGTDHVPLTDASGSVPTGLNGAHTTVHLVPFSNVTSNPPNNNPPVVPTAVGISPGVAAGMGELFAVQLADGFATDTPLFYQTSGGLLIEMTRNFAPVKNNNGYTFLPGGLILQWGQVDGTHGGDGHFTTADIDVSASFNVAFKNAVYNVWTQLAYTTGNQPAGSSSAMLTVNSTINLGNFKWTFSQPSGGSITRFYWFALGL